jgi:hypothetical protein
VDSLREFELGSPLQLTVNLSLSAAFLRRRRFVASFRCQVDGVGSQPDGPDRNSY